MATTTVTQDQQSVAPRQAKKSGLWWALRRPSRPATPPARFEYDGAPNPGADTALLPPVREQHRGRGAHAAGNVTPAPARTPRTDPDDIAANMIVKLGRALQPGHAMSSTALLAALDADIVELHKRAHRELELGQTAARREQRAQDAAAAGAAAIAAAVALEVSTGVPVRLDTDAIGARIARLTADAHAPEWPTAQLTRITGDMPDPRAAEPVASASAAPWANATPGGDGSSPVRGDGAAPVPDQATEPEPLPHRDPAPSVIAAPVGPDGPLHGVKVDPDETGGGDWVFRGPSGDTDGPVYRQLAEVAHVDGGTRLTYRNGDTQLVKPGSRVRVLRTAEAETLLAHYESAGVAA